MDTNYNRADLIDLYLLDKLSFQERKGFEEEMRKDDDLRNEVETMRHIMNGFQRKGETEAMNAMLHTSEEQMRSIIAAAENKHKQPAKKMPLLPLMIGIAASIAIILYIGIGSQPKYSSEELYRSYQHSSAYEYMPSRGGMLNGDEEHQLEQAIGRYNQGDYAGAMKLFVSIMIGKGAEEIPEEVKFYTALCMVQTGREQEALGRLESIASSADSEFRYDAQWNLALLYLKLDERSKCRSLLNKIIEDKENPYAGEAERLSMKLKIKKWF